jgi:hypothetical protein
MIIVILERSCRVEEVLGRKRWKLNGELGEMREKLKNAFEDSVLANNSTRWDATARPL